MDYVCPDHHNLESWGDANPSFGKYTLMQPTIHPLFNTRQFQETLLSWMDRSDYQNYLEQYWINKGKKGKNKFLEASRKIVLRTHRVPPGRC